MSERCSTCRYSYPYKDNPFLRLCRRFPPSFLYSSEPEENDNQKDWYGQPITGIDNWCGEYKQKGINE